jgi:hypothetical protein
MPAQENSLRRPCPPFGAFGAVDALGPHEPTDLRITRAWQPEFPRERAHTSIDLGYRLARIIEDRECREQPTIDPGC